MTELTVSVPSMFADHHVLQVRRILGGLAGLREIRASAATKEVTLVGDGTLNQEQVEQALRKGGYPPNEEIALPPLPDRNADESSWYTVIKRVTVTNPKDLALSGDFRKY